MTQPHDDGVPVEHDPTGMRALLAGLPDPGPMPDELVSRITAALAAEADAGAEVVPLRRRSSRLRHLGVAAAVVAAVGLGTYGVAALQGGGTASLDAVAGRGESGSDTSGESMAGSGDDSADAQSGPGTALPVAPAPGSGDVVVVMSGTEYTEEGLAASARSVAEADLTPLADLAAEAPSIGPIGTADRSTVLRGCAGHPFVGRTSRRPGRGRRPSGGRRRRLRDQRAHGIRHRALLHHGNHRPHSWPGVPGLSPPDVC